MNVIYGGEFTFVGTDNIKLKVDKRDRLVNLPEVYQHFNINTPNNFNRVTFKEALTKIKNKRVYDFVYECNNAYFTKIIEDRMKTMREEMNNINNVHIKKTVASIDIIPT